MKLTIVRGPSTDLGTFSKASLDNGSEYDWLELPDRNNLQGKSCIPAGKYTADLVDSPHFGIKVYRLNDVPGRTFVEIHPANWAGNVDKGFYADLLGCMAPGFGIGMLLPPGHPAQLGVTKSRVAFQRFMEESANQPLEIEIIPFAEVRP